MGLTEQRYKTLRAKLDELGYRQPLALESLLLVEHIFSDLIHTKEELDYYKNLVKQNQEKYGDFRTGVEPLKQENEKLVHECNRLRQALTEEQDVNEKLFKDLKQRIRALESNNSDLEFVCSQHLERINELSRHLAEKGQKILLLKGLGKSTSYNKLSVPKTHPKKSESAPRIGTRQERRSPIKSAPTAADLSCQPLLQPSSVLSSVADVCSASKKKIDCLLKELVTLKQEKLGYLEEIAAVQSKVSARNQEIERLQHMLELAHNTPMPIAGNCFCGSSGKGSYLESQLREQLTECQELQHEAMCRAVKLAERNAQLEEQLINNRSGGTCKCVNDEQNTVRKLQKKLDSKILELEELEGKVKQKLQKANKESETEKSSRESVTDEQKRLEERVRELTIIERDLLSEIERLTEVNRRQHDRIQHLDNRLAVTEKKLADSEAENNVKMSSKQMPAHGSKATKANDKTGEKVLRYQKSPARQDNANQKSISTQSKSNDAKKTVEKEPVGEKRPSKTATKVLKTRRKSKEETDTSSDSETNKANNDAVKNSSKQMPARGSKATKANDKTGEKVLRYQKSPVRQDNANQNSISTQSKSNDEPPSKSERISFSKSKKSATSSTESERIKEKEQEEEKLKREKQLLDDERKRLEETIRNLTEKQTELINKLQDAYAGSTKLNEQGAASGPSDKELIIKLERLQAERDAYQKELSKIRDQISNLVDTNGSAEPGTRTQSPSCILQSLVTERDFYQKEFNRLQKQLSTMNNSNHDQSDVGELRARLNDKEQEICCLKEKIRDLCAQQRVSPIQHSAQNGAILRLEMERDCARSDCSRLEEDRNALKEKLRCIAEVNKNEMMRLEQGSHALQTTITKLEVERRELINCLSAAKSKVTMLEKKLDDYRAQMKNQQTDLSQQITHLNHIKMLQEQTDRALSTSQDMLTQTEAEHASALERIHELEQQRLCLERELCCLRSERISLKSNMSMIDEEKDKLLLKADEKTEQVVKLERDCKVKDCRIAHLECLLADLQRKLDCALDSTGQSEQSARQCSKELDRLKQEMLRSEQAKDNALKENKRLQDDLAAVTTDHISKGRALEAAKREVEDLKMQLQGYVTEVRHIEDILEKKEKERSDMLEHYKSLSQEANTLESNNHTLESEARSSKSLLKAAEQEIRDLKNTIEDRDALVDGYEKQISELTAHIACLEMKLANDSEQIQLLERELASVREHCSKLDSQKQDLARQVSDQEATKKKVEKEYYKVQAKHDDLEEELNRERKNSATLENVLASTRQESLEKKLNNKELRQLVEKLEEKVTDLQRKLNHGNDALRQCQADTADYHQQLADLRREVTNERFERARADERAEAAEKELCDVREELNSANDEIDCLNKCVAKFKEKIAESEEAVIQKECDCEQLCEQLKSCEEKLKAVASNDKCTERLKTVLQEKEEQMREMQIVLEKERRNSLKSLEKNCEMEEKLMASFKQLEAKNSSLQVELDCLKLKLNALEADNVDLTSKFNLSSCMNEEYELQIDKLQGELNSFYAKRASSFCQQKAIQDKLSSAQELTKKLEKQKDSFLEQIMEIDNKNYHDLDPITGDCESILQDELKKNIDQICAGIESGDNCSQYSVDDGKEPKTPSDDQSKCSNSEDEGSKKLEGESLLKERYLSDGQSTETVQSNCPTDEEMENLIKNEEEIIRGYENQIEDLKQRLTNLELEKNTSMSRNCYCYCSELLSGGMKSPASKPSTVSQIENVISNLHMQLMAKDELLRGYTDEIAELAVEDAAVAVAERENYTTSTKSVNRTREQFEMLIRSSQLKTDESRSDMNSQITNRRSRISSPKKHGKLKRCGCLDSHSDEET